MATPEQVVLGKLASYITDIEFLTDGFVWPKDDAFWNDEQLDIEEEVTQLVRDYLLMASTFITPNCTTNDGHFSQVKFAENRLEYLAGLEGLLNKGMLERLL